MTQRKISHEGFTTSEAGALTAIPRHNLKAYIENGIITPARASDSPQSEYRLTPYQVWIASQVPALTHAGMSLSEIAELVSQGTRAFCSQLQEVSMREMREGRRRMKDATYHAREFEDQVGVGCEDDYVRYIPQRYFALAPIISDDPLGDKRILHQRFIELAQVAHIAGWSYTESSGILVSMSAHGSSYTVYAFRALTSPPMPTPTGMRAIDGGCYRTLAGKQEDSECDGRSCEKCARFGREMLASDKFMSEDSRETDPALWSRTVMADSLDKPYPTGLWSDSPASPNNPGEGEASGVNQKSATVRPRLMPHMTKLPLGITACVMPAHVYLCSRRESDARDAIERMMGQASMLPQRVFTVKEEITTSKLISMSAGRESPIDQTPIPDPFTLSHAIGDADLMGWWRELNARELKELAIPTNMALTPEDGYCIVCTTLPSNSQSDPIRYETQILVDAPKLTPPHRGIFGKMG